MNNEKLIFAVIAFVVWYLWRRQRVAIATGSAVAAGTGNLAIDSAIAAHTGCAVVPSAGNAAVNFRNNIGAF